MVLIRVTVATLIFVALSLIAMEWDMILVLLPVLSWSAVGIIIAFISWFLSRSITRILLVPFSRFSTRHHAVLVTGCDSGFGHLIAVALNRRGFFVFAGCYDRTSEGAKRLLRDIPQSARLKILQMDVTDEEQVREAFETVVSLLKASSCQLLGIVNNAGIMTLGAIEFSPPQSVSDFSDLLEVNALGAIRVTRTFLPLVRQSRGRVVNISSTMSRLVTPGTGAYCVSKAAISKFTEVLQVEMGKFGVTVIGIEPWISKTPMITGKDLLESLSESWQSAPDSVKASYTKRYFYQLMRFVSLFTSIPFDVQPEQVVDAVIESLTSPEPSPVLTVSHTLLSVPLWILNDIVPWEFILCFRQYIFSLIFHLLSVEQLFTGRPKVQKPIPSSR